MKSATASTRSGTIFDLATKEDRLKELESIIAKEGFWDNPEQTKPLLRERTGLAAKIDQFHALAREIDITYSIGPSLCALACAALAEGAYAEAGELLAESVAIHREFGWRNELGTALACLARADLGLGHAAPARQHLREALRVVARTNSPLFREIVNYSGGRFRRDGWRYDPVTDTWAGTTLTGAPHARTSHAAVWAGGEMIVWGGFNDDNPIPTPAPYRYDPATDAWTVCSEYSP